MKEKEQEKDVTNIEKRWEQEERLLELQEKCIDIMIKDYYEELCYQISDIDKFFNLANYESLNQELLEKEKKRLIELKAKIKPFKEYLDE